MIQDYDTVFDNSIPFRKMTYYGLEYRACRACTLCLVTETPAPVTGAAADEYNLNVVDCNASVTVARLSSISVSGGLGGTPSLGLRRSYSAVCVECLIGKQKKPILFKVTEPSSIPYRR